MSYSMTAASRWGQLDADRRSFLTRCEAYASYTLPKLCPLDGATQNNTEQRHDWQAVGAQAVNHLANKFMLAAFAPSRPFFRLDVAEDLMAQYIEMGATETEIAEAMSVGERKAIKILDGTASRPKMYEATKHLIVTGNVLLILGKDSIRIVGIKNYVVKRNVEGKPIEIMTRDNVLFDELTPDVQAYLRTRGITGKAGCQQKVDLYRWIKYNAETGDMQMTQHVDNFDLPAKFGGKWPEERCPYRPLTWDLSDKDDYGTGLVEDYAGDFAGLSALSKAQIEAAILASQFRWLVNPGGITQPEDLERSENGSVVPGSANDISIVQSNKAADLAAVQAIGSEYISRIGRGFLLGTAVTRDAERVTAEEIRMQATELESSLGGVYSRLAVDFQTPMAYWLLDKAKLSIKGQKVKPIIVTGLDALSRNGDLENLKLWLSDMGAVTTLPPALQQQLNMREIAVELAAGRGIQSSRFMKSQDQVAQEKEAAMQQQANMAASDAGAQAGAQIAVNAAKENQ